MILKGKEKYPDGNPKTVLGAAKIPLHLVPPASTALEAMAMGDGADKYGPYNWRGNAVTASVYVSACKRHLDAWLDGEDFAADSGVHHLGHAKACLGILIDAMLTNNLNDDRSYGVQPSMLQDMFSKTRVGRVNASS